MQTVEAYGSKLVNADSLPLYSCHWNARRKEYVSAPDLPDIYLAPNTEHICCMDHQITSHMCDSSAIENKNSASLPQTTAS
jgi:hypothetical protein